MSDLQRDIELVNEAFGIAFDDNDQAAEAWQRIRARLTPDRERVARAIANTYWAWTEDKAWVRYLPQADAAIDAARKGETP